MLPIALFSCSFIFVYEFFSFFPLHIAVGWWSAKMEAKAYWITRHLWWAQLRINGIAPDPTGVARMMRIVGLKNNDPGLVLNAARYLTKGQSHIENPELFAECREWHDDAVRIHEASQRDHIKKEI